LTGTLAQGTDTLAAGAHSHAEGWFTLAGGIGSHAEGLFVTASGGWSHAEGNRTHALGGTSHAEGLRTFASAAYSHAEGSFTTGSGVSSHAEGYYTVAHGNYSHAEGLFTIASGSGQTVVGKYNKRDNADSLFVVGNGTGDSNANRRDILLVNPDSVMVGSSSIGTDTFFYVGTQGSATTATFAGDTYVSGTGRFEVGISGSLTQLVDGTSYLRAGTGISIVTGSSGQITISAPDNTYTVGLMGSGARFTSIQAAIDQAAADAVSATVYIMPGSYTENITLAHGITLFGSPGVDRGVTINGSVTCDIGAIGIARPDRISALVNLYIDATGGTYAVDFTGIYAQELRITNCYLNGGATGTAGALRMNNTGVEAGLVSIVLVDGVLLHNTGTNTATPFVQSSGNLAVRGRFEVSAATANTVAIAWTGTAIAYMTSPNFFVTGLITATSSGAIIIALATISTSGGAAITQNGSGLMTLGAVGIASSVASSTTMVQGGGALLYAPASLSAINYNGVLLASTLNAGAGPVAARPGFDYGTAGQYLVSQGAGLAPTWASIGSPSNSIQYNNGGYFAGDSTFTFDSASKTVTTQNVVVTGDLTVNGAMTTVNTVNLEVKDAVIGLGFASGTLAQTAGDRGIIGGISGDDNVTLLWKNAASEFVLGRTQSSATGSLPIALSSYSNLHVANLQALIVTASQGFSGSLTTLADGNAYLRAGPGIEIATGSSGWIEISSSAITSPASPDRGIQYNDNGSFGASANFTFEGDTVFLTGSLANGDGSTAAGLSSHAEGWASYAYGAKSHAEGYGTYAMGDKSHVEGQFATAGGITTTAIVASNSTLEFSGDKRSGLNIGSQSWLSAWSDNDKSYHVFVQSATDNATYDAGTDKTTVTVNTYVPHPFTVGGVITVAPYYIESTLSLWETAFGSTKAGNYSHAEGEATKALGEGAHAEGFATTAWGYYSHAEGQDTEAFYGAHSEGYGTKARGYYSHAEGESTTAFGDASHAEGYQSTTGFLDGSGNWHGNMYAHAEGYETKAVGTASHAEGKWSISVSSGSHAEGKDAAAGSYYMLISSYATNYDSATNTTTLTFDLSGETPPLFDSGSRIYSSMSEETYPSYLFSNQSRSYDSGTNLTTYEILIAGTISIPSDYSIKISIIGGYDGGGATTYRAYRDSYYKDINDGLSPFAFLDIETSHAEGYNTWASGETSHAEGADTQSSGKWSHAEGRGAMAFGMASHAEGYASIAHGEYSHSEGDFTKTGATNYEGIWFGGSHAHAEGGGTTAFGGYSHAEGFGAQTGASGSAGWSGGFGAHAEGQGTKAYGEGSHAEGYDTKTGVMGAGDVWSGGDRAHAEGQNTTAFGASSHAEGSFAKTGVADYNGYWSGGFAAHAEGDSTVAYGQNSHAEGMASKTGASGSAGWSGGFGSHAEGLQTTAYGAHSHTEGNETKTGMMDANENWSGGNGAHAEGSNTTAFGYASHAEGCHTFAMGDYSHASGYYTVASGSSGQTVVGKYNKRDNADSLFVVGNGDGDANENRSDIFLVNSGSVMVGSASLAADTFFYVGTKGDAANSRFDGNVVISGTLDVKDGSGTSTLSVVNSMVGINVTPSAYALEVNGEFAATVKSFVIDHPNKPGWKLRHGTLEGPENGVYVRGRSKEKYVQLPDYWHNLVDEESITVHITPIGAPHLIYVVATSINGFAVDCSQPDIEYYYKVQAERTDHTFKVEYENLV
jgi:hypothetical protein